MSSEPFLVSLYDYTGAWAKPYIKNDWRVLLWDKQHEGCILENFSYLCRLIEKNLSGNRLTGLLVAPPCTAFTASGAQSWPEKDAGWPEKHRDGNMDEIFDSFTEYMQALVWIAWELKERFNPHFWVFENPVGRIEKLCPELKPHRKMSFDPCDYGDPYTKKTILWGEFNTALPKSPVEPEYIIASNGDRYSPVHFNTGGTSRKSKILRSQTPTGFARAFYHANHEYNYKQMKLAI